MTARSTAALATLLCLLLASRVGAQEPVRAVRVSLEQLDQDRFEPAEFASILAVELNAARARIDAHAQIELRLQSVDSSTVVLLRVITPDRSLVQTADLQDVARAARPRALALVAADLLSAAFSLPAPTAPEPGEVTIAPVRLPAARALATPTIAAPQQSTSLPLSIGVRARAAVLGGPTVLAGGIIDIEVPLGPFLSVVPALAFEYAARSEELGRAWVLHPQLGAAVRAWGSWDIVRVGGALSAQLGFAYFDASPVDSGVAVRRYQAFTVALEALAYTSVALASGVRIELAVGARGYVMGQRGNAMGRDLLALADVVPTAELGARLEW